jgi:electron transfer flavoprotein beta subunit
VQIVVCCKRVPDTTEAEVAVDASGKDIRRERLAFTINESDNYALEEALLIKEKLGGAVTLVSVGPKEADDVLRMGLAKGTDKALRLDDPGFAGSDGIALARILAKAIDPLKPDLVLCGSQASDDAQAEVGVMLAELLGLPHAAYVTKLGLRESGPAAGNKTTVWRELEGGLLEKNEVPLPAVVTVQTGINIPRYASIMGIKRAQAKELKVSDAAAAGIAAADIGASGSLTTLEKLYVPVVESHAEIIQGDVNEASGKLAGILKEKGLV